ncbi:hypothetical protein GLI01_33310 [Gluconacetobacter liquefaciens]|uniref:Porin n=1 Tax=Gluconacetobacter liquefaciens TaxID=89584 RepID=A0A370G0D1_GLULI|nr:hypothetical protein [Gluconacetobacter liquefaciens]MBB2187747.1 hypothetical protein [Gluconacetobacter liquefaciens]RDI37351.1 hypothetical protein C7453_10674 [Gluconacetobacter liquefaciens]GBQ98961.1 hypothetical protein AA0522_1165 [Gluconacetobacter liquefaciens NRIC 0522]GEB39296.1 hypothetical protein GLI01_33310 [Gluconacetobacter liquefaciens]
MQLPSSSLKRSLPLFLLCCSMLVPPAAHAQGHGPEEAEAIEAMENQISRIQEQQLELQKDLMAMRRELAQHRARMHLGHPATTNEAAAREHASSPHAIEGARQLARNSATPAPTTTAHHLYPGEVPTPTIGEDTPTYAAIVAHRDEDMVNRLADNNVGPHPRETAGAQATGALGDHGVFHVGPVTVVLGGYFDTSAVLENRHVASGTFNYWSAMPFPRDANYHQNNFEGSPRYSRFSLMARANIDSHTTVSGFVETDFGAGAETTNPYESNAYVPRLRQAYLSYDDTLEGNHLLIGQAWSLLTPGRAGIVARQESLPETIESSMLAGQTWTRQWQARYVHELLQHRLWLGLSIENPATIYDTTGFDNNNGSVPLPNGGTATIGANGTGLTEFTTNYSDEIAPDVIGKIAWDPAWGHYEAEGIVRFPHDRVFANGTGHNNTAIAGGGGGSAVLPVIPHKLEIHLAGLAGVGIGRYGSVLLPDVTLNAQGKPKPLPDAQATAGIVAHVNPRIDVYGYYGMQRSGRSYFSSGGSAYGYGNPMSSNAGCEVEMSPLACTASIRSVQEFTVGAWWRFLKGRYGTVEVGTQLAYSRLETWKAIGGAPSTSMSQIFFDFRYLPFQ